MQAGLSDDASRPLLVFVGAATFDALALVERYPDPDERVVASDIRFAGGGPSATAAVAAARLGHNVAFIGAVGADDAGDEIIAGLQREGVNTEAVLRLDGVESGASVVVITRAAASRAISNRPLPRADLTSHAAARELLSASAWVHTDHIGWEPTIRTLGELEMLPRTSFDGGHLVEGFTAEGLDLYVPTIETLARRIGHLSQVELLEQAAAESGGAVVATQGADGAWALSPGETVQQVPGFQVDVLSTLGAGDVFHGALLAQIVEGRPLLEAVSRANAVAALSTRALDGRSGIPTRSELEAFLSSDRSPSVPDFQESR
ncbi:carbohydrate kinase family protein [Brachybacterium sp. Marseille-Q7125]|uniref:carbohydrate kinase family protein n=1 Tax=Brachybacterium sp. Marseille-Q7125 TaxID=2932815 RepID=UPI001FF5682C|nr:carbohydrate kinase family protein [Brachybacterium sp. Marseille-Q7125]